MMRQAQLDSCRRETRLYVLDTSRRKEKNHSYEFGVHGERQRGQQVLKRAAKPMPGACLAVARALAWRFLSLTDAESPANLRHLCSFDSLPVVMATGVRCRQQKWKHGYEVSA